VPALRPRVVLEIPAVSTSAVEAVVRDFGSRRWWQGGPLFFRGGSADLAADAAVHPPVPICGSGLPEGPRHCLLPPGEVFDRRGM
jgi:hypothetical protein